MTEKEAQRRMYNLAGRQHKLRGEIRKLEDEWEALRIKRVRLLAAFPSLDLGTWAPKAEKSPQGGVPKAVL